MFKNKSKKITKFSTLFLATRGRSERTNTKEPVKTWHKGMGWPPLLLYVGKMVARDEALQTLIGRFSKSLQILF